jgi:hypothetical protein
VRWLESMAGPGERGGGGGGGGGVTFVSGVRGMWREKKSPEERASSKETSLTPMAPALASDA